MAEQTNSNINSAQALSGMNMNSIQRKNGELTYALNSLIEGIDGNSVSYQTEQSNTLAYTLPEGYSVLGAFYVKEIQKSLYFLTNPTTGIDQIGTADTSYMPLITGEMNFSIEFPIHKIVVKSTNCAVQFYWTDGNNGRRYIDMSDLPWKEIDDVNNSYKKIKLFGQLDINKLEVQPNYSVPLVSVIDTTTGGNLKMGTYQFAIQYSNSLGDGYTSYFSVSNPIQIFKQQVGASPDAATSLAINIRVEDLDISGLWDYFNIAVIKTINGTPTPYKVGTFPITSEDFNYTYSGTTNTELALTDVDVFTQFPYYDTAQEIFEVDGILGWADLSYDQEINFQKIWSGIKVGWKSYKLPVNEFEAYNDASNTANLRTYPRDEVYPLEGYFILTNGQRTRSFHIPGIASSTDVLQIITNLDAINTKKDPCDDVEQKYKWQVYNTATVEGYTQEWKDSKQDDCYVGSYQYGKMAYWESTDLYPNNQEIWGELSNTPIRHHKFPDCLISPIHDEAIGDLRSYRHSIYPIGFYIEDGTIENLIQASTLTQAQKDKIVGFGIARGNRAGGNKSIIAKGIFSNVGTYNSPTEKKEDSHEFLYANYPYNDLDPDPYFSNTKLKNHSGYIGSSSLRGFDESSKSRFTFHSPDTHFQSPTGINSGYLKLETIEYGSSYGHFQKVQDNARYKLLSKETIKAAAGIAAASGLNLGAGTFGSPTINLAPVPSTFQSARELFEKLVPYTNYGYTFHSVGHYGNSFPVPNNGWKIRSIDYGRYLIDGTQNVEEGKQFNNFRRESSVYLHTSSPFLFPTEYSDIVPKDTSRYTLASSGEIDFNIKTFIENLRNPDVLDVDIYDELSAYTTDPTNNITAAIVFESTMDTSVIPEIGDIFQDGNGVNYLITQIDLNPVNANTTNISVTASIVNYVSSTFLPPPEYSNLSLVYPVSGTASTSAPIFPYTTIAVNLPAIVTGGYTLATVRASLSTFINSTKTLNLFYSLLDGTEEEELLYYSIFNAYQRTLLAKNLIHSPETTRQTDISCYYGSIKKDFPSQWGRMYSYETIDTGYRQKLNSPYSTIFGGDTFINKFALKTKTPIFLDTTFNGLDGADVEYDRLGNYGWPMFWLSTRAEDLKIDVESEINKVIKILENSPFVHGEGTTIGKIWTAIKGIFTGGFANAIPVLQLLLKIFKEVVRTVGINNINLDNYKLNGIMEEGIYYMYVYGIPYFFVESDVNVDYRQASNDYEGNFYPNVSGGIPDDWLQEKNTQMIHDNSYNYNETYYKQNKEFYFSHLREDYDPTQVCLYKYPNRAIWAEQTNVEESKNHWLVYKPTARFDLSKSYGNLTSIDGIQNRQLLVRFENRSQIHNALTTIELSQGPQAALATPKLFSTQPLDLSVSDGGHGGSQHKFLLRTPLGHIYTDCLRGMILILRGQQFEDLSTRGMDKWFKHYLPFNIIKAFPSINIDNHYKDLGITGVYDSLYNRIIITKKDYIPLVENIVYNENSQFLYNGKLVYLTDNNYFCDRSFTVSYSFITQSWTSFHSYVPKYYIELGNYFQTGDVSSTWSHNLTFDSYHNFYGETFPYILEYKLDYQLEDEVLQNVRDYSSVRKYTDYQTFTEPNETIYFDKAIVSNSQQCTGILNLIPNKKTLSSYKNFPKINVDSVDVQLTKTDNLYNFNSLYNITVSPDSPIFTDTCSFRYTNKDLNTSNLNYSQYKKATIRAKDCSIRLIKDTDSEFRLISKFIISPTINSKL